MPTETYAPRRVELQINHPCCNCGDRLTPGMDVMFLVISIKLTRPVETTQKLAWCNGCWDAK